MGWARRYERASARDASRPFCAHTSIIDSLRLAKAITKCTTGVYAHSDMSDLASKLETAKEAKRRIIWTDGVLLAATAGAVNVQLGQLPNGQIGQVPQPMHLRAVVGLVWRTVVMWMVFLALLSLARLLG